MKRNTTWFTMAALAGLLIGMEAPAFAQTKADAAAKAEQEKQDAAQAAWLKYASPNEHHKALERLAGKWHAEVWSWAGPGAKTETMEGEVENVMIVGGLFLQNVYTGLYDGKPFVGMSLIGYDNHTQRHTIVWMDSINSATHFYEGTCENNGATMNFTSRQYDPVSGKTISARAVITIVNDDLYTYDQWRNGADGKPYKAMSMRYTRKK